MCCTNWHDFLFHIQTGKLKTFTNFNNNFVLFINLCLNKQNLKKVLRFNFTFHIQRINILFKIQNTTLKYFDNSEYNLWESPYVEGSEKGERRKFSFLGEKLYNKTFIDFNCGRHEDLSTLKRDINLSLAVLVNYHFFCRINPHVYLIEVNNCII